MEKLKGRNSNIELFRICCMFGIILAHMMLHTGALESHNLYVRIWAQFFNIFSKAGVNGFVIITAWFMSMKQFKVRKIYELYKTVWWYSILLGVCGILISPKLVSFYRLKATLFPVSFNHWWFVTAFMGMLIFIPVMNIIITKSTRKQLLYTVLSGLILFTFVPTFTSSTVFVSNLSWFCYLYLLTGFIRKYENNYKIIALLEKNVTWILTFVLIFLSTVVFTFIEKFIPSIREGTNFFTGMYILPLVVASFSAFLCFKNYNIGYIKWINRAGKLTFPVYLIQSNVFFTVLLWDFITNLSLDKSCLFPIYVIGIAFVIQILFMIVSIPIDGLKSVMQKLQFVQWIDKMIFFKCEMIDRYIDDTCDKN